MREKGAQLSNSGVHHVCQGVSKGFYDTFDFVDHNVGLGGGIGTADQVLVDGARNVNSIYVLPLAVTSKALIIDLEKGLPVQLYMLIPDSVAFKSNKS